LYGLKNLKDFHHEYALSNKILVGNSIDSYGLALKPAAMNIAMHLDGTYFHLAMKDSFSNTYINDSLSSQEWTYYFGKANLKKISKMLFKMIGTKSIKYFKVNR